MKVEDSSIGSREGQAGRERLLGPLRLELKQGCQDKAVSGGLEAYVLRWVPELAPAFAAYASLSPEARKKIAQAALDGLRPEKPVPAIKLASLIQPQDPLTRLDALGPKRATVLRALGLTTVEDLLYYTPRTWSDRTKWLPIAGLVEGQVCTVQGRVISSATFRTRSRLSITEVAVQDESGSVSAMYFNQPFQQRRFKQGALVVLSGKALRKGLRWQLQNPEAEVLSEDESEALVHTGRIVPLYALNKDISQRVFRNAQWKAQAAVENLADPLPEGLRQAQGLLPLQAAIRALHFPETMEGLEPARQRLAFDELLQMSLALALKKRQDQAESAPALVAGKVVAGLLKALPFQLTAAQARVWGQLKSDLAKHQPMRRLIQGDVGSGKTVLAALALAAAVDQGWQGALMAPTEILAEQHLKNLKRWLEPLGVEVLSLTQMQKGKGRREVLSHLASGQPLVAVGTQALIQEGVSFGKLGVVVADEQHRFGVRQRLDLAKKGREQPHALVMTATPIPRTLAMTAYGDLDVSVIDELPPGRSPIVTHWVRSAKVDRAWKAVGEQLAAGRQAYVVVPLVEESEKTDWKAATTLLEELRREHFPDWKVELLHGRMKPEEKDAVMGAFGRGEIHILCATTVVEVGVDVPNATVMVVEDADRFGLAQLHQLRGRVGRGSAASQCWLIAEPNTEVGQRRLEVMVETQDGFVIAEEDLKLRGPGEILGTRQSGLPELRQADLLLDHGLLVAARQIAEKLLQDDPQLLEERWGGLKALIKKRFSERLELGNVG